MQQRHDILFNQLESYRSVLLNVLEGVTEEMAEIIPNGFNNNIRWNMGHIYLDQYLWIGALTKEQYNVPEPFNKWFGFGTSPSDFNADTPSFEELKGLLKQQPIKLKQEYGDQLEEPFPPIDMGMYTIEQVLIRTIFHEGMHLQAIIDLRKIIHY